MIYAITICSIDPLSLYYKEMKAYVHMYTNIHDSFIHFSKTRAITNVLLKLIKDIKFNLKMS